MTDPNARVIEVEFEVRVYATVDLDSRRVTKVVLDGSSIEPNGQASWSDWDPTVEEVDEAIDIAEDANREWPAWDREG